MREGFIEWNPHGKTGARVMEVLRIVQEYRQAGYRLTLRQLYYQFVARDIIPNKEAEYRKLGNVVSKMRLSGLLDWDAIEDRNRSPETPSEWDTIQDLADTAANAFRLPRWEGQDNYCELWVEKAALAGVLAPLAREYHVTLMVNRGYSSQSAMYESAKRIMNACYADDKAATIFYLGDHDPSGQDMVRDIRDRLLMFTRDRLALTVECIALTTDQVEEYSPPPNPTKLTDSRAPDYIHRHGHECWEVDALDPETLQTIIRESLDAVVDMPMMNKIIQREDRLKKRFLKAVKEI